MNRRAFTLIELMVVVVIIGVLSSIAIPKFAAVKEQANEASCRSNIRALANAEAIYFAYFSTYGLIGNIGNSDILANAVLLRCPTENIGYTITHTGNNYSVPCPNGTPNHGSMVDGIPSW